MRDRRQHGWQAAAEDVRAVVAHDVPGDFGLVGVERGGGRGKLCLGSGKHGRDDAPGRGSDGLDRAASAQGCRQEEESGPGADTVVHVSRIVVAVRRQGWKRA